MTEITQQPPAAGVHIDVAALTTAIDARVSERRAAEALTAIETIRTRGDYDRRMRLLADERATAEDQLERATTMSGAREAEHRIADIDWATRVLRARAHEISRAEEADRERRAREAAEREAAATARFLAEADPLIAEILERFEKLSALRTAAVSAGASPSIAPEAGLAAQYDRAALPVMRERVRVLNLMDHAAHTARTDWPSLFPEARSRVASLPKVEPPERPRGRRRRP